MGDAESIHAMLKAFMEAWTLRQQPLEVRLEELAALVQKASINMPRGENLLKDLANSLKELADRKQKGSLDEYFQKFQFLLAHTNDLKPIQQNFFTAGLTETLRLKVELLRLGNLEVAIALARALEWQEGCFVVIQPTHDVSNMVAITAAPSPPERTSSSISGQRLAPTNGSVKDTTGFIKQFSQEKMTT